MAKTYTYTIPLKCWKEHTCASCNTVYSYLFQRKVAGTGGSAEKAEKNCRALVAKTLATVVDVHPCPACGIIQVDMIGQQRARAHKFTFWIALMIFIALLILRGMDVIQSNTATKLTFAAAALAVLQLLVKDFKNLNRDLESNRQKAAARMTAGIVRCAEGQAVNVQTAWAGASRSVLQNLAIVLLLASPAGIIAAETVRAVNHWPLNEVAYPPVIGPGDDTRIYMLDSISSIKGYWRGKPNVSVRDAATGMQLQAQSTANENNWGDNISDVKTSEQRSNSTPWIHLYLPNEASMSGKTVDCDIHLEVEYPQMTDDSHFTTQRISMDRHLTLQLAPAGAGATYNALWWYGTTGGMALLLLCAILLIRTARSLQRRANPTRILPAEQSTA